MKFVRTVKHPETQRENAYYLIFNNKGHLLTDSINQAGHPPLLSIPCFELLDAEQPELNNICLIGTCDDIPCFCAGCDNENLPVRLQNRYQWHHLRKVFSRIEPDFWDVVGYGRGIHDCHVNFKFCGKCSGQTELKTDEHGRFCPSCHLVFYPRISPAIIVAVVKEDKLLLARGVNFPNKKMFSVLAGFVEPQERLEDCVTREVFEETGIKVKNVAYFDSQPWPFPDSLMIGFTAEYESGLLNPDPCEILEAGWFSADHLPVVPGRPTLSGDLIQWFINTYKPA